MITVEKETQNEFEKKHHNYTMVQGLDDFTKRNSSSNFQDIQLRKTLDFHTIRLLPGVNACGESAARLDLICVMLFGGNTLIICFDYDFELSWLTMNIHCPELHYGTDFGRFYKRL